jgi:hypothetical protein
MMVGWCPLRPELEKFLLSLEERNTIQAVSNEQWDQLPSPLIPFFLRKVISVLSADVQLRQNHYEMLKAEYGGHLWNGCAGENILVDTLARLTLDKLAHGLAIQRQNSGEVIWLRETLIAHPCRPFSGYVMGGTEASVKAALQFLDSGMRGFYCQLAHDQPVTISIGDMLLIPHV